MTYTKVFLLLSFLVSHSYCICQVNSLTPKKSKKTVVNDSTTKVSWLKNNAVNIRTIEPSDNDFSDLMPLKNIMGDAQVIMIGEPNHFIATVYFAKTRLIEFLHKEMGFDLLTFESGIYDVAKAWNEIKTGKNARQAFKNSVFFGDNEEYKPLINYLQQSSTSQNPLEIAGFDSQLTGRFSVDSLFTDLKRFFGRFNYTSSNFNDSSFFARELKKAAAINEYKSPDKSVIDTINMLINKINSTATKPYDFETEYFLQLLKSIKRDVQSKPLYNTIHSLSGMDQQRAMNLYFSIRDEQMADNLLWYIKQYPKRKIIVWAQNVHVMNAYPGDVTKEMWNEKPDAPSAPLLNWENTYMGWIIKDSMKNKVFSIAITGNSGIMGRTNHLDSTKTFKFPLNKSTRIGLMENYLDAAGLQYAFVNLKKPSLGGAWLKEKIIIRHTGGNGNAYYWHKAIDALYYVRNFLPVNVKD